MNQSNVTHSVRRDLYQQVTHRIVEDLERGVRPWCKPWNSGRRLASSILPRRHNGVPYQGINILLLWSEATERGFARTTWMTYRQARELGGQVRKGESGTLIVFADRITRSEEKADGERVELSVPYLKGYTVFNVEQIDGLPEAYASPSAPPASTEEFHAQAEHFIAATRAVIRFGGDRAFYAPAADIIQLPPVAAFKDRQSYCATALHELTHWSGHESRCARALNTGRFGTEAYAFEELIAELGAAYLCAELEVEPEVREDHAAYLASWLNVLKQDKRAIFTAATQAQRAVDYLRTFQGAASTEAP